MNKRDLMRLQGMKPSDLQVNVGKTSFGKQLGNAMSLNVLQRLLCSILPAAGLVPHGMLVDPWESGVAQQEIAETRRPSKRARQSF